MKLSTEEHERLNVEARVLGYVPVKAGEHGKCLCKRPATRLMGATYNADGDIVGGHRMCERCAEAVSVST